MSKELDPEIEVMSTVANAFGRLEKDAQVRVFYWLGDRLALWDMAAASRVRTQRTGNETQAKDTDPSPPPAGWISAHPKVSAWLKQNSLSTEELEQVYFVGDNGDFEVIAAEIPGRSVKDRVLNVYILAGLASFLKNGNATFSDELARNLCKAAGCFDHTNHSKYLNDKGISLAGSKEKGWNATPPGLKQGAALVKEIASAS